MYCVYKCVCLSACVQVHACVCMCVVLYMCSSICARECLPLMREHVCLCGQSGWMGGCLHTCVHVCVCVHECVGGRGGGGGSSNCSLVQNIRTQYRPCAGGGRPVVADLLCPVGLGLQLKHCKGLQVGWV